MKSHKVATRPQTSAQDQLRIVADRMRRRVKVQAPFLVNLKASGGSDAELVVTERLDKAERDKSDLQGVGEFEQQLAETLSA